MYEPLETTNTESNEPLSETPSSKEPSAYLTSSLKITGGNSTDFLSLWRSMVYSINTTSPLGSWGGPLVVNVTRTLSSLSSLLPAPKDTLISLTIVSDLTDVDERYTDVWLEYIKIMMPTLQDRLISYGTPELSLNVKLKTGRMMLNMCP